MNNKIIFIKYFLIWLAGTISATIFALIVVLLILNAVLIPTYIQENNIINTECQEHILKEIEQIVLNVSNHEYIKYKYDCTNFAIKLVQELEQINVSSFCIFGFYKEEKNNLYLHTWISLILNNQTYHIEATNGMWISDEDYKIHYKEIKQGFCL